MSCVPGITSLNCIPWKKTKWNMKKINSDIMLYFEYKYISLCLIDLLNVHIKMDCKTIKVLKNMISKLVILWNHFNHWVKWSWIFKFFFNLGRNFVGNCFVHVHVLQCKTIHYYVKRSCERIFVGKGCRLRENSQTLFPHEQWWTHSSYIKQSMQVKTEVRS